MIQSAKGKLLALAVFALGIGIGGLATYEYDTRFRDPREAINSTRRLRERRAQEDVDRFHDYLGLTEEQREVVRKILEEDRAQFRQLQQKVRPEFQALQEGTRNKIRAILSDDQKQKYDEFRKQRNGRRGNP